MTAALRPYALVMVVRRYAVASSLAAAALCSAVLSACGAQPQTQAASSSTEAARITEVVIGNGSGDVTVRGTDRTDTRIDRVTRHNGEAPAKTYRIEGTVLHIDTRCGNDCSVSYDLAVPRGVAVRGSLAASDVELSDVASVDLTVSSGDVRIGDVTGPVTAAVDSGTLVADGIAGALRLTTTSSTIEGRDLHGAVDVKSTSGAVTVLLAKAAPVKAHTTSGDVTVRVPTGDFTVRATTQSGRKQVSVPDDPGATTHIEVETTSGDLTVASAA